MAEKTESVPSIRSSSSITVDDEIFHHELVVLRNSVTSVLSKETKTLRLDDKMPSPLKKGSKIVYSSRNSASDNDHRVSRYLAGFIPPNFNCSDVSVFVDKELDKYKEELRPFTKSVTHRPDVTLLWRDLPLVLVEVQSSTYKAAVMKAIVGIVDQLRLLRNYDSELSKCIGFVFPAAEDKQCVTKVTVEWKELSCQISLSALTTWSDVSVQVGEVITTSLTRGRCIQQERNPLKLFFMRLSESDCEFVGSEVGDTIVYQVPSRHSIVLRGSSKFWKCIVNQSELLSFLKSFHKLPSSYEHVVKSVGRLTLFGTPIYKDPLRKKEASDCLYSLVDKVGEELCNLHSKGVAHLDVRLDNICFTSSNEVVMIDFDRCLRSAERAAGVVDKYINSEMYTYTHDLDWTYEQLDWKQFGLLILWVLDQYRYHQDLKLSYSPEDSPEERKKWSPEKCLKENHQFLYDLLFKGQFLFSFIL